MDVTRFAFAGLRRGVGGGIRRTWIIQVNPHVSEPTSELAQSDLLSIYRLNEHLQIHISYMPGLQILDKCL
jgi:hypothetical protein